MLKQNWENWKSLGFASAFVVPAFHCDRYFADFSAFQRRLWKMWLHVLRLCLSHLSRLSLWNMKRQDKSPSLRRWACRTWNGWKRSHRGYIKGPKPPPKKRNTMLLLRTVPNSNRIIFLRVELLLNALILVSILSWLGIQDSSYRAAILSKMGALLGKFPCHKDAEDFCLSVEFLDWPFKGFAKLGFETDVEGI